MQSTTVGFYIILIRCSVRSDSYEDQTQIELKILYDFAEWVKEKQF